MTLDEYNKLKVSGMMWELHPEFTGVYEDDIKEAKMSKLLEAGDVIELMEGHRVYAAIPKHFLYSNTRGDWSMGRGHVVIEGELLWMAGRYIVTHTTRDGGGSSHDGSHPNGHHVFCERHGDGMKVDFYQSGCFTAMIKDIEPVGKATREWK